MIYKSLSNNYLVDDEVKRLALDLKEYGSLSFFDQEAGWFNEGMKWGNKSKQRISNTVNINLGSVNWAVIACNIVYVVQTKLDSIQKPQQFQQTIQSHYYEWCTGFLWAFIAPYMKEFDQLHNFDTEYSKLTKDFETAQQHLKKANEDAEKQNKQLDDLRTINERLAIAQRDVMAENIELHEQNWKAEERLRTAEDDLHKVRDDLEAIRAERAPQQEQFRLSHESLQTTQTDRSKTLCELKESHNDPNTELLSAQRELAQEKCKVDELRAELAAQEGKLNDYAHEIAKCNDRIGQLQRDLNAARAQTALQSNDTEKLIIRLKQQEIDLEKLAALRRDCDTLSAQAKITQAQLESIRKERDSASLETQRIMQQLATYEDKAKLADRLLSDRDNLQEQLKRCKELLRDKEQVIDRLERGKSAAVPGAGVFTSVRTSQSSESLTLDTATRQQLDQLTQRVQRSKAIITREEWERSFEPQKPQYLRFLAGDGAPYVLTEGDRASLFVALPLGRTMAAIVPSYSANLGFHPQLEHLFAVQGTRSTTFRLIRPALALLQGDRMVVTAEHRGLIQFE